MGRQNLVNNDIDFEKNFSAEWSFVLIQLFILYRFYEKHAVYYLQQQLSTGGLTF